MSRIKLAFEVLLKRPRVRISVSHCQCLSSGSKPLLGEKRLPPWNILFFGNDSFSIKCLDALFRNCLQEESVVEKLEVVSAIPQDNPVRTFCRRHSITVHDWPFAMVPEKFDVGVVSSFGALIPEQIIRSFPFMINVHPSLLPRWRGAAPTIHTVLKGDEVTGVTIIEVAPHKFDIGKILLQKSHNVPKQATSLQLEDILGDLGAEMLIECLQHLEEYARSARVQNLSEVTLARKIMPVMTYVDWVKHTTVDIDRMYRAFLQLYHLRTTWYGKIVKLEGMIDREKLLSLRIEELIILFCSRNGVPIHVTSTPGYAYFHKRQRIICIRCKDGWVAFTKLTIASKRTMNAVEFYGGYIGQVHPGKALFGT